MGQEFEKLEAGISKVKEMSDEMGTDDLLKLSTQLQRLIEFSAEVSQMIDACEDIQREMEARRAVSKLIEGGFDFQSIEIDGVRYYISDEKEIILYSHDEY